MVAEADGRPAREEGASAPGYRLMLKELAPDERPRERLKLRGPASLSDGDLVAIILNTGMDGSGRPARARVGRRTRGRWQPSPQAGASPRPTAGRARRAG